MNVAVDVTIDIIIKQAHNHPSIPPQEAILSEFNNETFLQFYAAYMASRQAQHLLNILFATRKSFSRVVLRKNQPETVENISERSAAHKCGYRIKC